MILYLVRHGQSEGNVIHTFHGWTDYPLTELGQEQARQAAEKLKNIPFTRCCVSDLQRASNTAKTCLQFHPEIVPEVFTDLREYYVGDLEGLSREEMDLRYPGFAEKYFTNWKEMLPPGGETPEKMMERCARRVDAIIAEGQDTLLASHFGTMAMICLHLGVLTPEQVISTGFTQGTYTAIEVVDGVAKLLDWNR